MAGQKEKERMSLSSFDFGHSCVPQIAAIGT